jgi:enamine deaminase RidA (YjgF/YER057c/UK114 family)
MSIQILQPPQWARPQGYAAGVAATGRQVFVSGQVGCNERKEFPSEQLHDQVRLALDNVMTVLAQAGARAEHVVRLTWYIVDRSEYHAQLKEIGAAYRGIMGRHYPAMSVVQVAALLEAKAKVEIDAIAMLP